MRYVYEFLDAVLMVLLILLYAAWRHSERAFLAAERLHERLATKARGG